ncbi:cytochrome P450 2B19-like [Danio aesculapii]|uniref:cytochrome P450 2B19-like n=1 Tax=Danio aesculapii TaxID=1142201 RepID=UPI0024BF3851|nr:cytochrome P450 2B19-like [Danio aesculapii]
MFAALLKLDLAFVGMTLVLGLIFMVLFEIFRIHSYNGRFPPGPTPLPFVGNLPHLLNPKEFIRSLSQYGEMTTMYLGRKPVIMLNTIQVAKEALVQDTFAGRPHLPIVDWMSNGLGIVMVTFNNSWKQQRRFAQHMFRNFGLGKNTIESRVLEESQYLIAEMLKDEGRSMNPHYIIKNALSNIICSIVFGDRFDYDNKHFEYLLNLLNENILLLGSAAGQIFNLFPFIKHFPGPHQKIKKNSDELFGFVRHEVEEHRKTLDPGSPRDYIDAYLLEMEKQKSNKDSPFHEGNLVISATDLFLAGSDSTATSIRWGLLFLIQNPDVQERCHEEIVQVLGYDRLPSMEDRNRLPYTHATVHEIQRCGNITPVGLFHETVQPTKLRGYDIPRGTLVMANYTAIFSNKEHWKHPDTFNPENFLDENGHFSKPESFIPFSLGPRSCLGESLVRTELFLFITSLIQRIHFSSPPDAKPIDMDGILGIVRYPQTFNVICCSRDTKD